MYLSGKDDKNVCKAKLEHKWKSIQTSTAWRLAQPDNSLPKLSDCFREIWDIRCNEDDTTIFLGSTSRVGRQIAMFNINVSSAAKAANCSRVMLCETEGPLSIALKISVCTWRGHSNVPLSNLPPKMYLSSQQVVLALQNQMKFFGASPCSKPSIMVQTSLTRNLFRTVGPFGRFCLASLACFQG